MGRRSLGGEWTPGRPFGRGEIVAEFHRVRKLDEPQVFVLVGVRGHQKSELLDYLRYSYARRSSWYAAAELEAKIDFFAIDPEPGPTFASLCNQLLARRSRIRYLRFPRFRRLEELLAEEQRRAGTPATQVSAIESDLGWLAKMGVRVASVVTGTPLPAPTRRAAAVRLTRNAWWRVSLTPAGRWMRKFERQLPDPMEGPDSRRRRLELLRHGLAAATAEDLTRATRRRLLPVDQVAVFVDGHQRVERSAQPAFIVDFAKRLAESRARVLIVVACREEERWSWFAETQPDCEDLGIVKTSERIQVHQLQPIAWPDRIQALRHHRVPAPLVQDLAKASAGVPLALSLLGSAFGNVEEASLRLRTLLEELPDPRRTDGDWFTLFSHAVAREMMVDLDRDLELHLRAAATVRNFDRELLKALLRDQFSDELYEALVSEKLGFVGTPRPSAILGVERSYRIRSFVREIVTADPGERAAVERWHGRAAEYLAKLAKRRSSQGRI